MRSAVLRLAPWINIKDAAHYFSVIAEPHYLILEYVMYGKLLAYLRDHRTRQYFYNFSEDSAALTSRDLTVFGYCVARGMEYLASKKVRNTYFVPHVHLVWSVVPINIIYKVEQDLKIRKSRW